MRLIYNPSGTSHARDALRIENRAEQRRHFTAGEKMKILRAVDAMVATENLPFNMAATRLGVNPISVKTWRKNAVTLSDSSVENKLILHKGPSGIVSEVKEELIEYVEHLSLVAKDQLLTTKHHRGSLHHLRSAAGVAGTRAAPVVCRRPDDVDESPHQTLEHNSMTGGHGGGNCPLHRHHRDPLGNGLLVHWRGGVLYRIAQGGETRLLATIDESRPGGRRHTGTRHDEVALGALRHAHRTVAARAIVIGVRARAAFPSYHLGRRSHGWGGFIVILLYILLALFLGAHHLLLHAHHRAT